MKILIITIDVGRTAPGMVFERLIKGLSNAHEVDVLTSIYEPSVDLKVNSLIKYKYRSFSNRLTNSIISLFSCNPLDVYISRKAAEKCTERYDLILSFICFTYYVPIITGNLLSRKMGTKHITYLVDAIPAPNGWLKVNGFYKGTEKLIAKQLSLVDGIFSANRKMLDYQLSLVKSTKKISSGVIYVPGPGNFQQLEHSETEINVFLYTGGLYGPRKPDLVLIAFKKLLKEFPNSSLEFVGTSLSDASLDILTAEERKKVAIHPFTKDLSDYYRRATALLDIDADLPNDVFLSSKIANYISLNRIIISVTGTNSASREIFKDIPSIKQCKHNADEIYEAMCEAIEQKATIDFKDRSQVLSMFNLDGIVKNFIKQITHEN